ncbi:MAG TPA: ParB/RepB/Spo0J family partition protein [Bacillota bacterium]|nr:ParB/RepB/Spo0J family partition protein [Bacillota bacterium]HNT03569.1 ParB/RepB/Spo0J family partition protein [Bacillota bacterium]HPA54626.1 ParB/RepB/Spo0J family partition protein [Bacillota bacterium]HPX69534.1 ParB/RepB/Spo0J family partition protein [Bacillota bacterium]HQA65939.1 ParB/RepB/Spo0J family partition protein [Bacillota bacterium]
MISRRGLGKGLGALIPEGEESDRNSIVEIKITDIEANDKQPRKAFNDATLADLSESIKEHGVVQPIIVRKQGNGYQIVAGERRWRAARLAGKKTIPAIIKECSNLEVMELALIENLQREDLNSIEEAMAYKSLIEEYNMTQEEISKKIGKSRPAIGNSLRLLQLPQEIKNMIAEGKISQGHARALLSISGEKKQLDMAEKIIAQQLNVRQIEKLAKDTKQKKKKEVLPDAYRIEINQLEERLRAVLGTKVTIHHRKNRGSIEIEYYSDEEFDRIFELLEK